MTLAERIARQDQAVQNSRTVQARMLQERLAQAAFNRRLQEEIARKQAQANKR